MKGDWTHQTMFTTPTDISFGKRSQRIPPTNNVSVFRNRLLVPWKMFSQDAYRNHIDNYCNDLFFSKNKIDLFCGQYLHNSSIWNMLHKPEHAGTSDTPTHHFEASGYLQKDCRGLIITLSFINTIIATFDHPWNTSIYQIQCDYGL